jgi:hypothetical protein
MIKRIQEILNNIAEGKVNTIPQASDELIETAYSKMDSDTVESWYDAFSYDYDEDEIPDEESEEFKEYVKGRIKDSIEEYLDNLEVSGTNINIYRGLSLSSLEHLDVNNLGVYWAYHMNGATDEYSVSRFKGNNKLYILEAKTNINNVDWNRVMHLASEYAEDYSEDEITIRENSLVYLTNIYIGSKNNYEAVPNNFINKTYRV